LGYTTSQAPLQKQVRRLSLIIFQFYVASRVLHKNRSYLQKKTTTLI
jgi:hypothetical protein